MNEMDIGEITRIIASVVGWARDNGNPKITIDT